MDIQIIIDSLTNCLVLSESGEEFDTEYERVNITYEVEQQLMSEGWKFDWHKSQSKGHTVYKLITKHDRKLQGMISIKHIKEEMYTFVDIVEAAPENIGHSGKYSGVGAHLFAIACKLSWDEGNEGYIQFVSKTDLVEHYKEKLGAKQIDWHTLYIDTYGAIYLINKYIKEV